MDGDKNEKIKRVFAIYNGLTNGEVINKAAAAKRYGVNERSIQRDLDDIRSFLEANSDEVGQLNSVVIDQQRQFVQDTAGKMQVDDKAISELRNAGQGHPTYSVTLAEGDSDGHDSRQLF